jgi:hypothetical protein
MTESNKDSVPYLLFLAAVAAAIVVIVAWMMLGSDRKPPGARDCNVITLRIAIGIACPLRIRAGTRLLLARGLDAN